MARADAKRSREDFGFFGPDSPTWRVWSHPATLLGFQRAVTIETLDPFLTAAVTKLRGVYTNPGRRFERTTLYFLTIAFGDGRSAIEASDELMRIHERAVGTEPVSGRPFSANDPDSQLWIHMTAWHSILKCYERFGPGALSAVDEARYWSECAVAAELQTIDVAKVPRSRQDVRDYFHQTRPRLALTDEGQVLFNHFLRPRINPRARMLSILWRGTSRATISTMPRWMRRLAGLRQGVVMDALASWSTRRIVRMFQPLDRVLFLLVRIAPSAAPVLEDALRGPAPLDPRTVTPAEARRKVLERRPETPA